MEYYKSHSLNAHTHTNTNTHIHRFVCFVRSFSCERVSIIVIVTIIYAYMHTYIYIVYVIVCVRARALSHSFSCCFCAAILSIEYTSTNHSFMIFWVVIVVATFFPFKIFQNKKNYRIKSNQIKPNQTLLHSFARVTKEHIHTSTICRSSSTQQMQMRMQMQKRLNKITDNFPKMEIRQYGHLLVSLDFLDADLTYLRTEFFSANLFGKNLSFLPSLNQLIPGDLDLDLNLDALGFSLVSKAILFFSHFGQNEQKWTTFLHCSFAVSIQNALVWKSFTAQNTTKLSSAHDYSLFLREKPMNTYDRLSGFCGSYPMTTCDHDRSIHTAEKRSHTQTHKREWETKRVWT